MKRLWCCLVTQSTVQNTMYSQLHGIRSWLMWRFNISLHWLSSLSLSRSRSTDKNDKRKCGWTAKSWKKKKKKEIRICFSTVQFQHEITTRAPLPNISPGSVSSISNKRRPNYQAGHYISKAVFEILKYSLANVGTFSDKNDYWLDIPLSYLKTEDCL